MKLAKTTFLSGIITLVKIGGGFLAAKVVAIYTGAAGLATLGAFVNFIAVVLVFANGAINNGVIKYAAEHRNDKKALHKLLSTSLRISLICPVIVAVPIFIFSDYISRLIFLDSEYSNLIKIFGVSLIFYSINTLIISILNGIGNIGKYTVINVTGSIVSLILTYLLAVKYGVFGALYSLVLSQVVTACIGIMIFIKFAPFDLNLLKGKFDKLFGSSLAKFSLMALISAVTVPVSQIILRNMLISKLGIDDAGYWQGLMRISDGYLLLVTTALGTYYLPKLSSITSDNQLRIEIERGYRVFLPIVFISVVIIYFLRFFIIRTLYTEAFLAMEHLFLWQMLGDFFKISAWILAYLMLAKSMVKTYIITEVIFSLGYVSMGYLFVNQWGLEGIAIAFFCNYILYLLTVLVIFRSLLFKIGNENLINRGI